MKILNCYLLYLQLPECRNQDRFGYSMVMFSSSEHDIIREQFRVRSDKIECWLW